MKRPGPKVSRAGQAKRTRGAPQKNVAEPILMQLLVQSGMTVKAAKLAMVKRNATEKDWNRVERAYHRFRKKNITIITANKQLAASLEKILAWLKAGRRLPPK